MAKLEVFVIENRSRGPVAPPIDSPKLVVLLHLTPIDAVKEIDRNDMITFASHLGLVGLTLDSVFNGADYSGFESNKDCDFTFFYSAAANRMYLSIVCNDDAD